MTMAEVHEIIDIALKVNGLAEREKKITGSLPTVFIDVSGHVACVAVRIHEHGWDYGMLCDKEFRFYTDKPLDEEYFAIYKRYMTELLERYPPPEVPNE